MPLTVAECRAAQPRDRGYQLTDSDGLYLYITPKGFKSWRLKYYFRRKEKRMTFGGFPEIGLKEARDMRDEARRDVRCGIDPGAKKKAGAMPSAAAPTFEEIATRWFEGQKPLWTDRHAANVWGSLEKEVLPVIGTMPIGEITAADIRKLLEAVQSRGAVETAHNVRGRISRVFELAIVSGHADSDPAAAMKALLRPIRNGRMPAIEKLPPLRSMLAESETIPAHPAIKLASRLLALTAARPGMVRFAEAQEFEDLDGPSPLWRVPAEKMKQELAQKEDEAFEFVLPLAPQAVAAVKAAIPLAGKSPWLFPSTRFAGRPMSENALSSFYRRVPSANGRHVPHGWRASFSTIMNERAAMEDRPGDRAVIDLMLAHKPQGGAKRVEALYNRAAYMPRRRELAEEWADMLLRGFASAEALVATKRR